MLKLISNCLVLLLGFVWMIWIFIVVLLGEGCLFGVMEVGRLVL